MKPGPADLWLWEARQARDVPAWARAFDEKTGRLLAKPSRDARIAALTHQAINARAGTGRRSLDLANAINLLRLVRKKQARQSPYEREPDGKPSPRTLAEYMRAYGMDSLNGRAYSLDTERYKYYRRWLRRLES